MPPLFLATSRTLARAADARCARAGCAAAAPRRESENRARRATQRDAAAPCASPQRVRARVGGWVGVVRGGCAEAHPALTGARAPAHVAMASAPGQPQLLPTPQQPVLLPPQPPQPQPQPQQQQGKKAKKKKQAPAGLPDALTCEDLCSRFILNCPAEELASFERIMFLVEQAHWFYEDFVREKRTDLKSLSLREFATHLFTTCVSLRPYVGHLDTIYKSFTSYKVTVPVYGCIVLNSACSRALMVKGWKAGASWGFPRGKVNKDEDPAICASREVYEETGLNLETLVDPETFLEVTMAGQVSRMYIVRGCDEDAARMAPIARKEISKIEWHKVADLPTTRDAKGANGNKYWNVHPFVKPLRRYIKDLKKKVRQCPPSPPPPGPRPLSLPHAQLNERR